jgi:hypothetical protein
MTANANIVKTITAPKLTELQAGCGPEAGD